MKVVVMRRMLVIFMLCLLAPVAMAQSDNWPNRPIRVVIPFGAGSGGDVIPRVLFDQLTLQLGQPIVVENRGGAGGSIGASMAAKAAPDGYTLLAHSSAHTIAPAIYPNLPYDAAEDFVAVGPVGSVLTVLVVPASLGVDNVKEFVAAAKAKPGTFNFASVGAGSAVHFAAERFRLGAGFEAVHIPFKSGAEALTELLAGRITYYFCPAATALPHIREGRLKALLVSGHKRIAELPDVPTTAEAGFADADYTFWVGVLAPAKTPPAIVARLNAEMAKAVENPKTRERLATMGVEPWPMSPAEFDALVKKEVATYTAFAKKVGLKAN
jgi:tripartite-type tricarboxylate transporter receptor subunit TctC